MVRVSGPSDDDRADPDVVAEENRHGWTTLIERGSSTAWLSSDTARDVEDCQ